jgi:flagellar biosynthesis protein FliR
MTIELGHYPQMLLLVLSRMLGLIALTPFYGGENLSARIRIAMALAMTVLLLPIVPESWSQTSRGLTDIGPLALAMVAEVFIGAGLALICGIFVSSFEMGGMIIGRASGLMMAQSLNPVSGEQNPVLSHFLQMLFILLVMLWNGHLALLRLLALSLQAGPRLPEPGQAMLAATIVDLAARLFTLGVTFALPVMGAALIVNGAFGLIARLAPNFNVLFLALPFRLAAGIGVLGVSLQYGSGMFDRVAREMLEACAGFLAA